nr:hypothetical protein [uncultured Nitratireductor sp.]
MGLIRVSRRARQFRHASAAGKPGQRHKLLEAKYPVKGLRAVSEKLSTSAPQRSPTDSQPSGQYVYLPTGIVSHAALKRPEYCRPLPRDRLYRRRHLRKQRIQQAELLFQTARFLHSFGDLAGRLSPNVLHVDLHADDLRHRHVKPTARSPWFEADSENESARSRIGTGGGGIGPRDNEVIVAPKQVDTTVRNDLDRFRDLPRISLEPRAMKMPAKCIDGDPFFVGSDAVRNKGFVLHDSTLKR